MHRSRCGQSSQVWFHRAFCAPKSWYTGLSSACCHEVCARFPSRRSRSTKKSQGYRSPLCSTTRYWRQLLPMTQVLRSPVTKYSMMESNRRTDTRRVSCAYHVSKSSHRNSPHSGPEIAKGSSSLSGPSSTQGMYWW